MSSTHNGSSKGTQNQTKDCIGEIPVVSPTTEQEPVKRIIEAMAEIQKQTAHDIDGECLEAMFPYQEEDRHPLVALKATADPDIIYMHKAMKEPDKEEFLCTMQ